MSHITAISNQKGGVGKTTVTFNLGFELAALGYSICFIDNDPQANLTKLFINNTNGRITETSFQTLDDDSGVYHPMKTNTALLYNPASKNEPVQFSSNIDVFGSSGILAAIQNAETESIFIFQEKVKEVSKNYDIVLIDCVPSFGNLQIASHSAADYLLVPTLLSDFSESGVSQQFASAINTRNRINKGLEFLGIVINNVDARHTQVERHSKKRLVEDYAELLFSTEITSSAKIEESLKFGLPIGAYKQYSDQARQYKKIATEYLERSGVL